jgi:hypothetical protein
VRIVEVSGAPLGSKAFNRIWNRPYFVDQLLAIWDQRHEDQRQRDEWLFKLLAVADYNATFAHNSGVKEEHRSKSVLNDMFPNTATDAPKKDIEAEFAAQTASIFEAEKRRRAEMAKKRSNKG